MSRAKGKFVFRRFGESLGRVSVKYLRSVEKFSIRFKKGVLGRFGIKGNVLRIGKDELYELFKCSFMYASELSSCASEEDVDAIERAGISWSGKGLLDVLGALQYEFVFNWDICCKVIRAEHLYRLGRLENDWVELSKRSKGSGQLSRRFSGQRASSSVTEAYDNVRVALKYRDEAWFVEYCRRICSFEGKEFDYRKVLEYFKKNCG